MRVPIAIKPSVVFGVPVKPYIMKSPVSFYVPGLPKPAGSKRGFLIKRNGQYTGKVAVVDACEKSREWKAIVAQDAAIAMVGQQMFTGPVKLMVAFHMPRLKSHFGTGRNANTLKVTAPKYPAVKPDLLKLTRAIEDAMTGIVWRDDAQIVIEEMTKIYANGPGCEITVTEAAE